MQSMHVYDSLSKTYFRKPLGPFGTLNIYYSDHLEGRVVKRPPTGEIVRPRVRTPLVKINGVDFQHNLQGQGLRKNDRVSELLTEAGDQHATWLLPKRGVAH